MNQQSIPIVWASALITSNKTTFTTLSKDVVVEAPRAIVAHLLEVCNGSRRLNEVIDVLSQDWDRTSIEGLIEELFQKQVIGTQVQRSKLKLLERLQVRWSYQRSPLMLLRLHFVGVLAKYLDAKFLRTKKFFPKQLVESNNKRD